MLFKPNKSFDVGTEFVDELNTLHTLTIVYIKAVIGE